jgi:hypothetical protein
VSREANNTERTYTLLEDEQVILGQRIGLGDDGDKINTGTKSLHDLNVKRLQAKPCVTSHHLI